MNFTTDALLTLLCLLLLAILVTQWIQFFVLLRKKEKFNGELLASNYDLRSLCLGIYNRQGNQENMLKEWLSVGESIERAIQTTNKPIK